MPTIKEIIAAREAAKNQPAPAASQPGKPISVGLVLTKATPTTTPPAPAPLLPERRSLSEPEGEAIPLAPLDATPAVAAWHEAMNAFDSELCLMRDPINPEFAWFAVRFADQPQNPILLHKLPFWEHPRTVRPESEPF